MEDKYVYWDSGDYEWREIDKKYLETPKEINNYFGYLDDKLDNNNELIIYKLVPYKTLKKEIDYKFKD